MPAKPQPVRHTRSRALFVALVLVLTCVLGAPAAHAAGYIFWGNNDDAIVGPSIGRADRDGTHVDQAFALADGPTVHVAVAHDQVYWNWGGGIGRANADGTTDATNPTQSFVTGLGTTGEALAADAAYVYWSQGSTSAIGRVPSAGTPVDNSFVTGVSGPTALAVDGTYLYYAHDGDRIGRVQRDGTTGDDPDFITGATDVMGIAVDASHIYWSEFTGGRIGRANIDGSAPDHSFITGGNHTFGVAVDGGHVYWANQGDDTIGRAPLNGLQAEQAFITGAHDPTGLAVLPYGGPASIPVLHTVPASPANDNAPRIAGTTEPDATVAIYDDAACTHQVASGTGSQLAGAGIPVAVADDSTTTFRATATDQYLETSQCSAGVTYVEDSTPPATPADVAALPPFQANDLVPRVKGTAEAGSLVKVFTDPACGGDPIATGDAATFASPGIALPAGSGDPATTPYYATATDAAGNASACTAAKGPEPGLSDPQVGKTANIAPVSGTTTVKCPGTSDDQLTTPRQIPIGCTIDATNGRVAVTTANGQGANQTANFYDGKFKLLYTADRAKGKKTVFTLLNLVGPKPRNCKKSKKGKKRAAASKASKGRSLWGSGKGRYRTRGSHSAATVRGTIWLTKDTCAGTLTVVRRGVVDVWDFGLHKRVTVRKGHRYLARA
jgi:hypothetical protein